LTVANIAGNGFAWMAKHGAIVSAAAGIARLVLKLSIGNGALTAAIITVFRVLAVMTCLAVPCARSNPTAAAVKEYWVA
jgi:hypothetical protein